MKQILVVGAGKSAPFLIHTLLQYAVDDEWFVTVGDVELSAAQDQVKAHACGRAIAFDIRDEEGRAREFSKADVVVNMLAPMFLDTIARECVKYQAHLISVSYETAAVRALHDEARERGVVLLSELGLDPGIDHMSAMAIVNRVRGEGGQVRSFYSYGGGLPAVAQEQNPLRYVVTWNPRNVAMAGAAGARYLVDGHVKIVPPQQVFANPWPVEVDGVGTLEAYANRDSLPYIEEMGLEGAHTMVRGTLRFPGFCDLWQQIVRLGLPNESIEIPDLDQRSYAEVMNMFLPSGPATGTLRDRVAEHLHLGTGSETMDKLAWLGLFSNEPVVCKGTTAAAMLIEILQRKLVLKPEQRDLVILMMDFDVEYPDSNRNAEHIRATLVTEGEAGGFTAMAKTVGLPAALAVRLLLKGDLPDAGRLVPTHPSIYGPLLHALESEGLGLREKVS